MKKLTLDNHLDERKKEFANLQEEIRLLGKVKVPLTVEIYDSREVQFFSDDYSLAEDFRIRKRSESLGGCSGYDGGYSTIRYDSYPQFYFSLKSDKKVIPVYMRHDGFDEDKRIVIKSVTETSGSKEYSNMNGKVDNYVDLEAVFKFFRGRGVKESLLDKLGKRIKEAGEF